MDLKENRIVLFQNESTGPSDPTYQGEAQVNGQHYSIVLWTETSKKGVEYFSGKIEPWHPKERSPEVRNAPAQPPPSNVSYPEHKPEFRDPGPGPAEPYKGTEKEPGDDLPF
jgi:hypothetical protein